MKITLLDRVANRLFILYCLTRAEWYRDGWEFIKTRLAEAEDEQIETD